jgi:hypothetical protein
MSVWPLVSTRLGIPTVRADGAINHHLPFRVVRNAADEDETVRHLVGPIDIDDAVEVARGTHTESSVGEVILP